MSLDLSRLENVRHLPGKITARCPACAEEDRDRTGNHLVKFDDGKFSCIADPEHKMRIRELVGIKTDRPRLSREEWFLRKREDNDRKQRERGRHDLAETAKRQREHIVNGWRWDSAEIWEDSPTRPTPAIDDPRIFLASLFSPDASLWTGEVIQSGESHKGRWRTVEDWWTSPIDEVGPMTTAATWRPDTINRTRANVATAPFIVLDFDGPQGWTPANDIELQRHLSDSLALVRWLRERLHWKLAAIVYTGSKSIHAWFDNPGTEAVDSLHNTATSLGIDPGLIGHPEHPCRLPGQIHEKTGRLSRVLWLV